MPDQRPGPVLAESKGPHHHVWNLGRSDQPRRTRRRGRAVLLVLLIVVAGAAWFGTRFVRNALFVPTCTVSAGGVSESFDPEQTGNAALITAISMKRDLPPRAATIALATAYQESKILNIRYGDRDSLGLFQQRPSQGWGTKEQILDPVYSTNKFYDALVKVDDYENGDVNDVAQAVQRSGHPEAYRDHEGQGRVLASTITGHSPAGLTCSLDPATAHAKPTAVAADLVEQMGVRRAKAGTGRLTVTASDARQAWAVAHWAVARADRYGATRVTIGERAWERETGADGWSPGTASTTVVISLTPAA